MLVKLFLKFLSLFLQILILPINFIIVLLFKPRKKIVQDQLKNAGYNNCHEMNKKFFSHLFLTIQELIFMIGQGAKSISKRTRVVGYEEHFKTYHEQKKSILVLTAHLGNWEWLLAGVAGLGIQVLVLVKRVKNPILQSLLSRFRTKFGTELGWEENSMEVIRKGIKEGKVIGVVLDQYMGPPVGTKVNFFGRGAGTMKALSLLSKRHKLDVIPVFCYREGFLKMRIEFWKPLKWEEISDLDFETQVYTSVIEEAIRKKPEQWFWIHRRWKQDVKPKFYSEQDQELIGKKVQSVIQ